ncbi:type VI secretion system lipoprotein TssJ [Paraburkholderia caribensis]|jgi:type VI secretion system protein VasD|uniref:Type VI secretion system lipoprotein TssJ n=1 Tax=Paraburkholderia caribensis TaxID=75105 RepID=A0A9Q6S6P9_9BURK|nr:type VI secretion system lipoprotein TssJ [Paraburkholderia caribensis]MCO4879206.1 type VI secretion system lipoprotein TssJ [Paraburkholderia caribensis]PTB27506.1 type VI secretion system lipoprotein TssJ [Paraburkholderia caribensis]QLB65159.1 type VI secretion system-associated lipoprotein [Paraburkholderia caribensis]
MNWKTNAPGVGALMLTAMTLAGCGLTQAVSDNTVDAAKWVFTTQVKTMSVDLVSRASLNENAVGQSLSTVVRLYQLKDAQSFQQLEYAQLQTDDLDALKADLLATRDVVLRPNASASINEPMKEDTQYVGVVAFFRNPDRDSTWKLLVPKKQWKKTDPVKIVVRGNVMELAEAKPEPVKHDAPQQSAPNAVSAPAAATQKAKAAAAITTGSITGVQPVED